MLRIIVANAVVVEAGSSDFKCVALSRSSSLDLGSLVLMVIVDLLTLCCWLCCWTYFLFNRVDTKSRGHVLSALVCVFLQGFLFGLKF